MTEYTLQLEKRIRNQRKEIERLHNSLEIMHNAVEMAGKSFKHLHAATENSEKEAARAAVQMFADRLKTYYNNMQDNTPCALVSYHIDQIAKEVLEDG